MRLRSRELDALGRWRVDAGQQTVKPLAAITGGQTVQPCADLRVLARTRKQSARQRPIVETGPADEHGHLPTGVHLVDCARRVAGKVRRVVIRLGVDDVDEVMPDATALGDGHLVGADVEAAEDGRGVAVDDLAAESLRQRQGEGALASRRRPEHRDERPLNPG